MSGELGGGAARETAHPANEGAGRETVRPTDWERIDSEAGERTRAQRAWDAKHEPTPEFENAARPLPPDYGSHRPKNLDLTPEQVNEIEEFTGRPITDVLAVRDNDPRAGHNRHEPATDARLERSTNHVDQTTRPEMDNPAGEVHREARDERATADAGRTEVPPQLDADADRETDDHDPREQRVVGPAPEGAKGTEDVRDVEGSDRREDRDHQSPTSPRASVGGSPQRVITLGDSGIEFVDNPEPSSSQRAQADAFGEVAGGWTPNRSVTGSSRGSAGGGQRLWWMQESRRVDVVEQPPSSTIAARVTNETGEPAERIADARADRTRVALETETFPGLNRDAVVNRLTELAGTSCVEVYNTSGELVATEFPGEDARSAVVRQRIDEVGVPVSVARYDLDAVVKGAVEGVDRIMVSARSLTEFDDHRFPSFVSAVQAASPEGTKIRLYSGVHGESIVMTGKCQQREK